MIHSTEDVPYMSDNPLEPLCHTSIAHQPQPEVDATLTHCSKNPQGG